MSNGHALQLGPDRGRPYPDAGLSRFPAPAASDLTVAALVIATGVAAGYALVSGRVVFAIALCVCPFFLWLMARPAVPLVLLGATLPLLHSFALGGYLVTVSDLLLVLVAAGILLQGLLNRSAPALRALRPVAAPVVAYGAVLMLLLPLHLSLGEVAQTTQRFELFLFPLLVGSFAALTGRIAPMLQAYAISTTVLAIAWPLDLIAGQKNPVGQLIGGAIILLAGVRSLRRLFPCLLVLVPGLLLTESRGAIIATIIGVIVMMVMQGLSGRRLVARVVPLVLIAAVAFVLMPHATQTRITTLSAASNSPAAWAIEYRQQYARDAWQIIHAHPWAGVGVGNYLAGNPNDLTQTNDPHRVLLLQAAEGGYVLAAAYLLLILGSLIVIYMMRRVTIAPAAAGVVVATFSHGMVDVYWVRVTPVLSWLLVGMVCGLFAKSREVEAEA